MCVVIKNFTENYLIDIIDYHWIEGSMTKNFQYLIQDKKELQLYLRVIDNTKKKKNEMGVSKIYRTILILQHCPNLNCR